jgi:Spy/CpxP family protein refolding chaperone
MKKYLLGLVMLALGNLAIAQQDMIELARADIRSGRMGLIATAMDLTPQQQEAFWPIYRQYADEQEKLLDKRIAMLREFSNSYDQMDAAAANSIAKQSFAINRARTERRERYFGKFSEAVGPVLAARFIQVDSQITVLMDFELMRQTPLILPPESTKEGK